MTKELVFFLIIDSSEEASWIDSDFYDQIISEIKKIESLYYRVKDVDIHISILQFNEKGCTIDNSIFNMTEYHFDFSYQKCEGEAIWSPVFEKLNVSMVPYSENCEEGLLSEHYFSYRPIVLFISSLHPSDNYVPSLNLLRHNPWYNMAHKYFIDVNGEIENIPEEFTLFNDEIEDIGNIVSLDDCIPILYDYDPYDVDIYHNNKLYEEKICVKNASCSIIETLFPIYGIFIGQTSIEDVEERNIYVETAYFYKPDYPLRKGCEINGIKFIDPLGYGIFTECELEHYYPMPDNWEDCGLDWNWSEKQWEDFFFSNNFTKISKFHNLHFLSSDNEYEFELFSSSEGKVYQINCIYRGNLMIPIHVPSCNMKLNRLQLSFEELAIHPLGVFNDYYYCNYKDFNDYLLHKSWKWEKHNKDGNDEFDINKPLITIGGIKLSNCYAVFSKNGRLSFISYTFELSKKKYYSSEWEDIKKQVLSSFVEGFKLVGVDFYWGCYRSLDDLMCENKLDMNILNCCYQIEFEDNDSIYNIDITVYPNNH